MYKLSSDYVQLIASVNLIITEKIQTTPRCRPRELLTIRVYLPVKKTKRGSIVAHT